MKNRKKLLWIIIPVILIAAGVIIYALTSAGVTHRKMSESGATLYHGDLGVLHASKVYIGEDGRAYIDYIATPSGDDTLSLGFKNVEINGWAMYYHDLFPDHSVVTESSSGTYAIAEADILERAGITDIYDVRFEMGITRNQTDYIEKEIRLTVKDAPQVSAGREPVDGEQVLLDNDDFTLIAETADTGIAFGSDNLHYVQFYLENKTGKTLFADVDINSVNDLSLASFFTYRLTPGAKARLPIPVSFGDFDRFGMTTVDKVDLCVDISDKDFNRVLEYTDFELYFNGYTADTLPGYTRTAESGEKLIIDDDRFTFVIFGAERWDAETYIVRCYIENKTDGALTLSTEESIINGVEVRRNIDGYGISAHRKMYENMIFCTDPSDTGEAVDEFRFRMNVHTSDDSESVVVSPDEWFVYVP